MMAENETDSISLLSEDEGAAEQVSVHDSAARRQREARERALRWVHGGQLPAEPDAVDKEEEKKEEDEGPLRLVQCHQGAQCSGAYRELERYVVCCSQYVMSPQTTAEDMERTMVKCTHGPCSLRMCALCVLVLEQRQCPQCRQGEMGVVPLPFHTHVLSSVLRGRSMAELRASVAHDRALAANTQREEAVMTLAVTQDELQSALDREAQHDTRFREMRAQRDQAEQSATLARDELFHVRLERDSARRAKRVACRELETLEREHLKLLEQLAEEADRQAQVARTRWYATPRLSRTTMAVDILEEDEEEEEEEPRTPPPAKRTRNVETRSRKRTCRRDSDPTYQPGTRV